MSLNTRCPACQTVFKVVPDQLKVSSGWVRCGRCAEVFDAATHMLHDPLLLDSPLESRTAPGVNPSADLGAPQGTLTDASINPTNQPSTPSEMLFTPDSTNTNTSTNTRLEPDHKITPSDVPKPDTTVVADVTDTPDVSTLHFVRHAQNKAFWQQTKVVLGLWVVLLGLIGLLLGQVAFQQRHVIAATYPDFQPLLARFVSAFGGSIQAVQQLDALKIESSSFQKTQTSAQGDTFDLRITLKNTTDMPLAVPALELSLTDANDQTVVRRVLTVQELNYPNKTLAALGEWSSTVPIFVKTKPTTANEMTVTGYRVLAFYP